MKNGVKRWLILADGYVVDVQYSEKNAHIYSNRYAERLSNQDEPLFPKMTIVEETLDD